MTCGTQEIFGLEVQPNQNRPIGSNTEAIIIGTRRSSGTTLPCFASLCAKRVFVVYMMRQAPSKTPIIMAMNGRAATPVWVQPRTSPKDIG